MKRKFILFISFIICIISSITIIIDEKERYKSNQTYIEIQEQVNENTENFLSDIDEIELETEVVEQNINNEYLPLVEENSDFIGWLNNQDAINYPIMQCQEDSNFYLNRDFYKNESKEGSIYIPNDITINDKLVLIYGHHMKDKTMFGTLENYLNKDYFEENKYIVLNTLYEEKTYEVVAVFISKIYDNDYTGFKYYDYRGNITEEEFNTYIENIESLVQIGNISNLNYDDNFIELITCWYSEKDARLVVLCKEI